ncbi:MAG: hypothetical protein IJP82_05970 [Bacteroidaceae bacterium]|nr:hypothetical protein [Bacteroidaceae bacterium]
MKKSYYRIAIERYFSTPVPYCLIGTVPLMLYGYYENDLCFWIGLALTVVLFGVNHLLMHSLTTTFGLYATKKQVDYVSNFVMGNSDVFSKQESMELMEMMADQAGNNHISIDDYINYINHQLEEKSDRGNAEATYWLGIYHRLLGETDNHNSLARELIEKSAEMGFERAKEIQERAKKWQ